MTKRKPTSCPSLGGMAYWKRRHHPELQPFWTPLAYKMEFWVPGNGPRGRWLRLASSLGEGDAGLPMGSGIKMHLGLQHSSDAASSR